MFPTYTIQKENPKDQLIKRIRNCRRLEAFSQQGDDAQEGFLMCSPTAATETWSIFNVESEKCRKIPIPMGLFKGTSPGNHKFQESNIGVPANVHRFSLKPILYLDFGLKLASTWWWRICTDLLLDMNAV